MSLVYPSAIPQDGTDLLLSLYPPYAANLFRPFALLLFKINLPDLLLILLRNPCFLALFLLLG